MTVSKSSDDVSLEIPNMNKHVSGSYGFGASIPDMKGKKRAKSTSSAHYP